MNCFSSFMTFWTMLFPNELGISAHILAHVFDSVSRQHHEVWASQFLFLQGLWNMIPPSGACPYGCINWSLAQAQQQPSMGLSQSFPSKRAGKARQELGFHFTVQKRSVPGYSCLSLVKRPHLESGTRTHPGGKKSSDGSVYQFC